MAVLKKELGKIAEVVVSAPRENQSGAAHSGRFEGRVERLEKDWQFFGYGVYGRPADAVRFGILELGKDNPFDLVVSGINRGANVGLVSHLSRTVGAAMETQYLGLPSIAVSQDVSGVDTENSAIFTANLVKKYQRDGAPEGTVISINIPAGEIMGVAARPMGDSYIHFQGFRETGREGNIIEYEMDRNIVSADDPESDTHAYQQGYITLTPLKFDWTDREMIQQIESWNLVTP